jgi:uncharacterized membrane protein
MTTSAHRDSQRWVLLGSAAAIAALYALDATWLRPPPDGLPLGRLLVIALLLLPMHGVWRSRGRSAFWYALLCTVLVAHALLLALDDRSRTLGLALLAANAVLFVAACAFVRRHGLRPD